MSVLTTIGSRTVRALRSFSWPSASSGDSWMRFLGLPNERDYARFVGDGSDSNLVEAVVRWLNRYYIQAPVILREYESDEDDIGKIIRRNEMLDLLRWPTRTPENPRGFYSGTALGKALVASYVVDGNAYALKVRSELTDRPIQLWYVPHWWMEPMWSGTDYITSYRMRPDGGADEQYLRPQDVIHIRDGIDPHNPRKGYSGMKKLLRELYVDEKTARFTAALITNFGVPGIVISPEGQGTISKEQANAAKQAFMDKFGNDKTGEPLVMRGATKVTPFGWSPKDLDISAIRDVPEERVSSVSGIPAAVLNLGSGMHQVKVGATLDALIDMGIMNAFVPLTTTFGEDWTMQLLPDFLGERKLARTEVAYDLSRVPVMAKWWLDQATMWTALTKGQIARRSEARRRFGLPVTPEDDVYIVQAGVTVSPDGELPEPQQPLALPSGRQNDTPPAEDDGEDAAAELTGRQRAIAEFITAGFTNKQIAEKLDISIRSVERDVTAVLQAANVTDRRALSRAIA